MFKKLIIGLVVVFALILGGVSAYVSTIDWNKHKDKIAQQFENVTGKKIVFEGNVSLSVFPSPYLTAKNIKIYNQLFKGKKLLASRDFKTDLSK